MVVATLVWWRSSPVGLVAVAVMCGGDGLADVVGRRLGRTCPLPFNPAKSWAGSAAMFAGALGCSAALLAAFDAAGALSGPPLDWSPGGVPARLALISAACAAVEAAPLGPAVDDNLSVPAAAAALAWLLL